MQVWERQKWQLQKNGIEKCKFQKGENNNCKTNALNNVSLREDTVANEDNLGRGTGDKWRTIGKNKGKLEENTHNLWKNITRNATWEKGTCHMQHKSEQQISLDRVVNLHRRLGKHEILKGNEQSQQDLRSM